MPYSYTAWFEVELKISVDNYPTEEDTSAFYFELSKFLRNSLPVGTTIRGIRQDGVLSQVETDLSSDLIWDEAEGE